MALYEDPRYDISYSYSNSSGEKSTRTISSINVAPPEDSEPASQPSVYGVGPTTIRAFVVELIRDIIGGTFGDEPTMIARRPIYEGS